MSTHVSERSRGGAVVRQSFFSGGMASVAVATGLMLDVVAAATFGAGRDTDAFVVAARFPLALTAILMLVGNQVLVPTFATWSTALEVRRTRRLVTTALLATVAACTAVAGLLFAVAGPLVAVLAPGFEPDQRELAAELLRVMVWTIPLTAGCEVLRAWLNARHLFVIPAAMTVVLNVVAAGTVVVVGGEISILPLAYVAGSVAQLALMLLYAFARGLRLGLPAPRDAETGVLLRLFVRPSVAATLNPLTRAAETFVASFLPPGSATVLHYGHRLVHAVGGTVLFRSVMVAVLPRLTRASVHQDHVAGERLGNLGLRLMVAVSLPLTALGVVLAIPAAQVVFGIGRFSAEDALLLGLVIAVLSLSFPASAVQRALLSPFYAVRNTRVPLRNSVAGAVANLIALPLCVLPLLDTAYPLLGVAAAYVVSNVVNVVHARRRLGDSGLPVPRVERRVLLRSIAASLAGGGVAALVWTRAPEGLPGGQPVRLAVAGLLAVLVVVALEWPRRAPGLRPGDTPVPARRRAPGTAERLSRILAIALCAGVAVALTTLAFVREWGSIAMMAPIGLFVGLGLVALAFVRFEMFLLALLVTRTSLDAVGSGSSVDPAAMLGMLFLGAAIVWLLADWRETGRLELSRLGWAAVTFAGAALIGVIVAPAFWPALVEWTRLASVCVMLLVVERAAARARFRRQVVAAVAAAAVVPLVVAAWQIATGAGLFDAGGFSRARGTFTHSNPLAAFLALLVIMTFAQVVHHRSVRPRVYAGAVFLVAGVGLFATYTRAAWLAAVLGIAVVAAARGRRWLGGVAVILLILLVTVPGVGSRFSDLTKESTSRGEPSNSLTWRAEYWGEALGLQASPITGIGLKQVAAQSTEGKQPHNDFLRAYVEMGLIGLAAYLWLLWQVLASGVRAMRVTRDGPPENRALAVGAAGVAAGYVLMSLVANLMSQVVVGLYFAAFVAVGAALVGRARSITLPDLPAPVRLPHLAPAPVERREELQCASST